MRRMTGEGVGSHARDNGGGVGSHARDNGEWGVLRRMTVARREHETQSVDMHGCAVFQLLIEPCGVRNAESDAAM